MQYLVSVIDDGQARAAAQTHSASDAEHAAIDVFDVALKLATEGSKACNRKLEVRPLR